MILDNELPELALYRRLERLFPIEQGLIHGRLVVQDGNERLPIHRWFRFKEGFSADLLGYAVKSLGTIGNELRLLDPFCGVGTTLLSAQELSASGLRVNAIGIERNPFIAFVAQAKLQWPDIEPWRVGTLADEILGKASQMFPNPSLPRLSSLTTGRCMSRHMAQRLLSVKQAIELHGESATHKAFLLGLAAAIEPLSKVRKDGRALRIVERSRQFAYQFLRQKWNEIAEDSKFMQAALPASDIPRVIVGDGRIPTRIGIEPESIDLILTSPPYPNNIDYSEVYKLELWLLGFVKQRDSFLDLRKSTFRSHPTSAFPDPPSDFEEAIRKGKLKEALQPLLGRTQQSPEKWRHRLIIGYFSDLWTALQEQQKCLRENGRIFLVIGNSLHGGKDSPYLIPTDLIASLIGECVGLKVERVLIARGLKRRLSGNHFLRESLIVLRKDRGSRKNTP
jgi:hypothetical protein